MNLPDLPVLAAISAKRQAEFERLTPHAASGLVGSVAARKAREAIRVEQLKEAVRK